MRRLGKMCCPAIHWPSAALTFLVACTLTCLLLGGCAGPTRRLPPPASAPPTVPPPAPAPPVAPAAPPPPAIAPPARSIQPAALSLLKKAETTLKAGNALQAEGYLERAIRIEPQSARIWHTLARSKFQQRQYPQTVQMSIKSNSCRPDRQTEKGNWLLMERAYLAMGDKQKAQQAHAKALTY